MIEIFPNLQLLLTGYFHQDWHVDSESPTDVVAEFTQREPREAVQGAILEIERILAQDESDATVERILKRMKCGIDPRGLGRSPRSWLEDLRKLLEASTA